MSKTFVGLAMSTTMFSGDCQISRKVLTAEEAKERLSGEIVSCLNPSHATTIEALRTRFGIEVEVPETAPKINLEPGDVLIVLSARFTRRLNEGERYSLEEVCSANFEFVEYRVWRQVDCPGCGMPHVMDHGEQEIFCPSCDQWRMKA